MSDAAFEGFEPFVHAGNEFLITSHVDPDGDAVGSSLGLKHALQEMGKTAEVVLESPLPETLAFLPGASTIRRPGEVTKQYASAFLVDSSSADRAGQVLARCLAPNAQVAVIDHHWGNGGFGFANTSSRTLRVAARLVEHGARAARVAEALYATKTAPSLRILGLALASLQTRSGGRIGAMSISLDMFEKAGAKPEDADG